MSDFLNDYKVYYVSRAKRYAGNPDYHYSAIAEANLSEAMQGCSVLDEFRSRLGNLNHLCAVALVKDKCNIRMNYYLSIAKPIHADGEKRIFNKADNYSNVSDLITMIGDEENKTMIAIALDDVSAFVDAWQSLEQAECYEKAVVPDKWKEDIDGIIKDLKKSIKERLKSHEAEMVKWKKGWKQNTDIIHEPRHRRLLPYPDTELEFRLAQYKSINNK